MKLKLQIIEFFFDALKLKHILLNNILEEIITLNAQMIDFLWDAIKLKH